MNKRKKSLKEKTALEREFLNGPLREVASADGQSPMDCLSAQDAEARNVWQDINVASSNNYSEVSKKIMQQLADYKNRSGSGHYKGTSAFNKRRKR